MIPHWRKLLIAGWITLIAAGCGDQAEPQPAQPQHADYGYATVFFDFDQTVLTKTTLDSLRYVAAVALKEKIGACVIAHADRAGSEAYNLDLSRRRAEAIRHELIRNGVPATSITVQARGESKPIIQTQDDVREPQNRYAIVYAYGGKCT